MEVENTRQNRLTVKHAQLSGSDIAYFAVKLLTHLQHQDLHAFNSHSRSLEERYGTEAMKRIRVYLNDLHEERSASLEEGPKESLNQLFKANFIEKPSADFQRARVLFCRLNSCGNKQALAELIGTLRSESILDDKSIEELLKLM